jgi:hypothetical protein
MSAFRALRQTLKLRHLYTERLRQFENPLP